MRAWAESSYAITIVNAIPTGVGAALAVSAKLRVLAEPSPRLEISYVGVNPGDNRLVESVAELVRKKTGWDKWWRVEVRSVFPPRRGLKTSSAAANALVAAMMLAAGAKPTREEVLDVGVEAAIRAGVTVTGAFDDAAASLLGGLVVADNLKRRIIRRMELEAGSLEVLVAVPVGETSKSSVDAASLKMLAPVSRRALMLLDRGQVWDAMTLNGSLVAAALGVDDRVVAAALGSGALAAGVTGTGPAIAAVARARDSARVAGELESYGKVMRLRLENKPGSWGCLDS